MLVKANLSVSLLAIVFFFFTFCASGQALPDSEGALGPAWFPETIRAVSSVSSTFSSVLRYTFHLIVSLFCLVQKKTKY